MLTHSEKCFQIFSWNLCLRPSSPSTSTLSEPLNRHNRHEFRNRKQFLSDIIPVRIIIFYARLSLFNVARRYIWDFTRMGRNKNRWVVGWSPFHGRSMALFVKCGYDFGDLWHRVITSVFTGLFGNYNVFIQIRNYYVTAFSMIGLKWIAAES